MHFDDRLATVLRHRASGERAARTQFRQLLDLLGSRAAKRDGQRDESLLAAAWLRLGALGEAIPASTRAAIIQEPGMRFRNPELAVHLAEDEPDVAAAALARADLADDDWEALIPRLPVRARGFLRLRRDLSPPTRELLERLGIHDRGLPEPVAAVDQQAVPAPTDVSEAAAAAPPPASPPLAVSPPVAANDRDDPADAQPEDETAIGVLVKRIEAFRKARAPEHPDAPRLPLDETESAAEQQAGRVFHFTCDVTGRVDWADRRFAPMVVGTSLGRTTLGDTMRYRQPVRAASLTLEGGREVAGDWIIDAAPRFTQPDGRFFGYAGTARRPAVKAEGSAQPRVSSEADRLRQLLHELRTPVNAIQGFSEVIQQQLFGPTPHEYRALAASIAGDSARMLAGFDELDRLAKLETGAMEIETGESNFAEIVERLVSQLDDVLKPRTASFELATYEGGIVPISQNDAELLAWRLLATLASSMGAGEHLQLEFTAEDDRLVLSCELPLALATRTDLFAASASKQASSLSAGMFGSSFALRLVKAEARAAGGGLNHVEDWLQLSLPLLTQGNGETSDTRMNAAG